MTQQSDSVCIPVVSVAYLKGPDLPEFILGIDCLMMHVHGASSMVSQAIRSAINHIILA